MKRMLAKNKTANQPAGPLSGKQKTGVRQRLKRVVEENDSRAGRAFDVVTQVLIILSLVSFSLDTLPDLTTHQRAVLHALEVATVLIFTAEYALRIFVAGDRVKFVCSFYGIIDLIAILPFYLTAGMDLRAVRLLWILKLMRYNRAAPLLFRAFYIARHDFLLFLFMSTILFYLAGVGIYYFENAAQPEQFASIFHSLWWAVITLTAVGYGDVVPVTIGGRCFTLFVLILGLGVISIPAGLIASAVSKAREEERGNETVALK